MKRIVIGISMMLVVGWLIRYSYAQITSWNYFPPPNAAYDSSIPQMTIGGNIVATAGSALLQAIHTVNYSPGALTTITSNKGGYTKFVKASTVDNVSVSAALLVCVTNPTLALLECGTSNSCASPTTIASATLTSAGAVVDASVSSSSIAAGDYIAWSITAGACTSLDISGSAQVHST